VFGTPQMRCAGVAHPNLIPKMETALVIPGANALRKRLVRAEGLEPPQLSSLEPKSSASTSSATPAEKASGPAAMPRAAAYNMRPSARSIKMASPKPLCNVPHPLDIEAQKWSGSAS
jgi:hypothetical protein